MSPVLSNKEQGIKSSCEQPLVGEERYVTTRITAAKETKQGPYPLHLVESCSSHKSSIKVERSAKSRECHCLSIGNNLHNVCQGCPK